MIINNDDEELLSNDEVEVGCNSSFPCNPKRRLHRYLMLISMCLLGFGSFFCYDNPAALENEFMKDLSLSGQSYMELYAFFSWPNIILSCIGGFLIDYEFLE